MIFPAAIAPADIAVSHLTGNASVVIQKALDEAAKTGATVVLKEGRYELHTGLKITKSASLKAAPGAVVTLTGGRKLIGWVPVTDQALLSRLPASARAVVRQVPLPVEAAPMTAKGKSIPVRPVESELFIDGEPMTVARWPNTDWATTGAVTNGAPESKEAASFTFDKAQLSKWAKAKGVWAHGYWLHDWADELMPVSQIDASAGTLTLEGRHSYGFGEGKRFFVQNLPEELDQAGEYWIDREGKRLIYWPRVFEDMPQAELSNLAEPLITVERGVKSSISDLRLRHGRGTAISLQSTQDCRVDHVDIEGMGARGIDVENGSKALITNSYIGQTGAEGIAMIGGDRPKLLAGGHLASRCEVTKFGRLWRTYRPGVSIEGVANGISQCHIHEGGHSAILFFNSNFSVMEYNRIERVCLETDDAGAIYAGRDWTCQGNAIRTNWISDVTGRTNLGAQAIYLDDAASGTTVFGNIIERVQRAILVGGGRDNSIMSNLVLDCPIGLHLDARGLGWMKDAVAPTGILQERWRAMPVTSEAWKSRFPALPLYIQDSPGTPKNNRVTFNAFINSPGWDVAKEAVDTGDIADNLRGTRADLKLDANAILSAVLQATEEARLEPMIDLAQIGCKVERIKPRAPAASP